jgi:hypothetical protein
MKICMGDKQSYDNDPGATEPHFGFPFVVQDDLTLVCEVPNEMIAVANMELTNGRIELYVEPKAPKKTPSRKQAKAKTAAQKKTEQEESEAKIAAEKAAAEKAAAEREADRQKELAFIESEKAKREADK